MTHSNGGAHTGLVLTPRVRTLFLKGLWRKEVFVQ